MASNNLTVQLGVTALDANKSRDNEFYSFGIRFDNCGPEQLEDLEEVVQNNVQSILDGFAPILKELKRKKQERKKQERKGKKPKK